MSCEVNNTTQEANFTGNKEVYENVYNTLYRYGLPIICACGFVGNVMNLIILAGKRVQHSLRRMERSANVGLIALAVADMSFCITAFPTTFLPQDLAFNTKGFLAYYSCYCAAVINIFIFTSTWLTVAMSSERYLAICHPLRSRNIITLPRTKVSIIMVYILSAVFNLPVFWRYSIVEKYCENHTSYQIEQVVLDDTFDHTYRAIWAALGNFIPLVLLLMCNIGLMLEIHKSYNMRKQMNGNAGILTHSISDQETNHRITVTLVAIVVMFFILVAPSEIMKHVAYLCYGNLNDNFTYLTIEIVTNLMQTINFSANFILYCIINPSFRKTMREMFCFGYQKLQTYDTSMVDGSYQPEYCGSLRLASIRNSNNRGGPGPPRPASMRMQTSSRKPSQFNRNKTMPPIHSRPIR